jgi:hypothetical protein
MKYKKRENNSETYKSIVFGSDRALKSSGLGREHKNKRATRTKHYNCTKARSYVFCWECLPSVERTVIRFIAVPGNTCEAIN